MHSSSKSWVRLLVACFVALTAAQSFAAPLAAGSIATPNEPYGGVPVIAPLVSLFATPAGPGAFSGTLTSKVFTGDPLNPYGGLTFVYKIDIDAGSSPIERMTNINFAGMLTDVSYDGAGVATNSTTRTFPTTVGWNFDLGLLAGQSSAELIIQTNAAGVVISQANLIDGQVVSTPAYGPDGQIIPEPAALGLLGSVALMALRRRK